MSLANQMKVMAQHAKQASLKLSQIPTSQKNKALVAMAKILENRQSSILQANRKDLGQAHQTGLSEALRERLSLDSKKILQMAEGLRVIAKLKDPVGETLETRKRPNGLVIQKVRVPLGVIAIIYESRPNVTADCAGLCLKSGNSVILRGGREALHSNKAIFQLLNQAAVSSKIPEGAINLIQTTDRKAVDSLLKLSEWINLVIPRGGESLIRRVVRSSHIPVIKHYKGVCHVYIDRKADLKMAESIALNAKVQNPGVCNAMETLLVHRAIASKVLPGLIERFKQERVEIRGDSATRRLANGVRPATEADWYAEYLDRILAVRVVNSLEAAVDHIQRYGSAHSDAIVTKDRLAQKRFAHLLDSACVFINASTRFSDGGEFGMGAEMGISTDKIHARGPMGLAELTSYKYIIKGSGQIRR